MHQLGNRLFQGLLTGGTTAASSYVWSRAGEKGFLPEHVGYLHPAEKVAPLMGFIGFVGGAAARTLVGRVLFIGGAGSVLSLITIQRQILEKDEGDNCSYRKKA